MAGRSGPEAVKESVAATILANINAQLDTIYAEFADATTPEVYPTAVYATGLSLIPTYPCIVVTWLEGKQISNGAEVWAEFEHTLDVSALVIGDDTATVDRMIDRYVWALWRLLMQNQALDGTIPGLSGIDLVRYMGSPLLKRRDGLPGVARAVSWEIMVRVMESV